MKAAKPGLLYWSTTTIPGDFECSNFNWSNSEGQFRLYCIRCNWSVRIRDWFLNLLTYIGDLNFFQNVLNKIILEWYHHSTLLDERKIYMFAKEVYWKLSNRQLADYLQLNIPTLILLLIDYFSIIAGTM